ncbi:efflux RND transporter periplasmic adaptor subunit [Myxococcus sp. RHSTA-1-4]|uniref:efflux RND transporter periplasmic adaptor subunit n=1 Tax=Myxococcus sp. RHSTA-1-4 TaxID=2874601 RepID=UPI001CBA9654|nr:efflux RND transporter periplasmic adaptor subunit [Myxococcus sp. RHSTA-1-4]MBZ4420200.1 efflux RND transporter periplasmic adaptor subunit [Myxococcus sp. RHSTA-1-4]
MKARAMALLLFLLGSTAMAQGGHAGHGAPAQPPPSAGHEGHGQPPGGTRGREAPGGMPEGYAEVRVAPERQQLIGLKVAKAERGRLTGTVRASAIVQPDETREAHVHSKLMGWVQELFVNAVGQPVKKGQPLYSLYSQELFAAQQEYLRAKASNAELAAAARARLRLWDVPADQVTRIERNGPQKAVIFRSPIDGTVIDKQVLAGHYVEPEMLLYRIADLSRVWVLADVYEFEVNRLDRNGLARVEVQGVAEPVQARVDYVYPTVDPVSRTVKVRLVVPNPQGTLRPGSFATVELPAQATDALWVPEEAVVDTGTRQVVYVALGEGRFRPTLVKVGRRAGDRVELREGLAEGAAVVVSAQFLIDSESRLRGTSQPSGHGGH